MITKTPEFKIYKISNTSQLRLNFFRFQHASCRILSKERNFLGIAPKHKFSPKTLDTLKKLMCARLMGHYPPEMEYSVMVLIFVVQKYILPSSMFILLNDMTPRVFGDSCSWKTLFKETFCTVIMFLLFIL